jgi:hypothetical protein
MVFAFSGLSMVLWAHEGSLQGAGARMDQLVDQAGAGIVQTTDQASAAIQNATAAQAQPGA